MATAQIVHAWEDVKAMFNGGTRKRLLAAHTTPSSSSSHKHSASSSSGGAGNNHANRESGKGSSSSRGQSHGENSTSGNNTTASAREHSRNASSHQTTKKEVASASNASGSLSTESNAQHQNILSSGYDAQAANNFLQQTPQNSLLHVSSPLLSPTARLDSIWNPGLPGPRPCPLPGSPPFTALPFHPLSIPWLRRPIFPFSHPFAPNLLNEPGNTSPEKLVNIAVARQNQSAFKPVSRSVDPIFNWINGNGVGAAAGALALGHSTGIIPANTALPEDLSLNSSSATPGATINAGNGQQCGNTSLIVNPSTPPFNLEKQMDNAMGHGGNNSGNEKHHHSRANHNNNANGKHHQIQILSTQQSESDDEENVDIESTAETEECSSTSSIWVSSTTALGRSGGATTPNPFLGHNNNNTIINNNNLGFSRRKRLANTAPCYSSGDEDVEDVSDNHEDTASSYEHYEDIRSSEREKTGKKKRVWVDEIITTDEEEDGRHVHSTGRAKAKGENKALRNNSSARVPLNLRE